MSQPKTQPTNPNFISRLNAIIRVDAALLLTLALSALALWPLLYRPGLPNGNDVLYHVFRTAEMSRTWDHGVLFPRWAETFYTGYGAPVFHYYASLSYYVTCLLMRLFGLDALNGLRALIVLCVLGGSAGMYGFTRHYGGKLGGLIAALAYTYSPYLLFTEPYSRGAYPEMAAFALFPVMMLLYARLLRTGSGGALVAAALSSAALIITHNLMALVLTGLLTGWLLWSLLVIWLSKDRTTVFPHLLALIAVGSGVALAAYFWLPVVLEGSAAHLNNLTGMAGVAELDYRRFFVPLSHLLAFSLRYDEGALNGLFHRFNLGVAQWMLAGTGLAGMVIIRWRKRQASSLQETIQRPIFASMLYFALAGLACIFLMLPESGNVWGLAKPLAFLQFPWRFLGPTAFCLAFLAGMNAHWIQRLPDYASTLVSAAIVPAIIGLALPALYAPEWIHPTVDTSVAAYHQEELAGRQRATTFSNEYLPSAVKIEPGATPRLLADYADGYPVNKAHLEALPDSVTVEVLEHGPQQDVWRVTTPAPFTLEVLTFDFAGWTATVDGQPVPITPSDPHGLITLPVPAGEHVVRLVLGSTPARNVGNIISLGAVVEVAVIALLLFRHRRKPSPPLNSLPMTWSGDIETQADGSLPPRYEVERGIGGEDKKIYLGLIIGSLAAFILAFVYLREGGAWEHSAPGEARLAQQQTVYHLGESIQLLGYDLNSTRFRPGDRLELSVYWYSTGTIPYGYSSFVHVTTGGPPAVQADKLNPADRPTKTWATGGYLRDDYTIELPTTLAPGEYQLMVGLYTCDTRPAGDCGNGERLPVTTADGHSIGDAVPLATIKVR